jgi:hypothetical protein
MTERRDCWKLVRRVRTRLTLMRCAGMSFLFATIFAGFAGEWAGVAIWGFGTLVMGYASHAAAGQLDDAIAWARHEEQLDEWIEREGWNN